MLKHASHAAGGPANGQLRNNGNTTTTTAPTSATAAAAARSIHLRPPQPLNISTLSAAALNISTASAATSTATSTPIATTTTTTGTYNNNNNHNGLIANGGQRIPNLLNISAAGTPTRQTTATPTLQHAGNGTAGTLPTTATATSTHIKRHPTPVTPITPLTPLKPLTPLTPLTPNSIGINHNLHTYTNQHMLANHFKSINNNYNHNHSHNNTLLHNHSNTAPHYKGVGINNINNNNTNTNQHNYSNCNNLTGVLINQSKHGPGPREALTSLGLLCLVSLLLALLSLIFLLKISPNSREDSVLRNSNDDFVIVYDVTLALCALSLSLNLCCLLVCAIQFLFAVKLVRSPTFEGRDNKYLEKSSASRTCAVGGFFISIPIFLTGIILYTFNHFHSTPAIITSVLIGVGIVFCGGAMVHNVFIWQKEKTISYRSPPMISHIGPITPPVQFLNPPVNHLNFNQSQQSIFHPTSVTPVSPNHSHGSFNPLACGAVSSSFLIRPATATPPTPKPIMPTPNGFLTLNTTTASAGTAGGGVASPLTREDRSSVSPNLTGPLDMSVSLHELSTLV